MIKLIDLLPGHVVLYDGRHYLIDDKQQSCAHMLREDHSDSYEMCARLLPIPDDNGHMCHVIRHNPPLDEDQFEAFSMHEDFLDLENFLQNGDLLGWFDEVFVAIDQPKAATV